MITLFPERQEAIKVLYEAAARLLDNAAQFDIDTSREINRNRARECVEIAERISRMGAIVVIVDRETHDKGNLEVKGIPFNLGFVVYIEDSISEKE